ncbi:hypothetical protein BDQ12DRAFT_671900 [Crucibulum laeve]|uniref:Uncharacterized protein n=1 Tax=Crucibulum laeve TaxID=68775 RepID=A0A5C3LGU4_9AGAR|nr:hypothetical protein BDQ12DRAFT_671900 [Crucibulum laeve]
MHPISQAACSQKHERDELYVKESCVDGFKCEQSLSHLNLQGKLVLDVALLRDERYLSCRLVMMLLNTAKGLGTGLVVSRESRKTVIRSYLPSTVRMHQAKGGGISSVEGRGSGGVKETTDGLAGTKKPLPYNNVWLWSKRISGLHKSVSKQDKVQCGTLKTDLRTDQILISHLVMVR